MIDSIEKRNWTDFAPSLQDGDRCGTFGPRVSPGAIFTFSLTGEEAVFTSSLTGEETIFTFSLTGEEAVPYSPIPIPFSSPP